MKNEENLELKNEINNDLVFIKVNAILEEIKNKFDLLSLIDQSEDNSSELAGFEINKLLKEQSKLENLYNRLINKRTTLKGIKNKEEYVKIQVRINDVSRSLKESTKKLCRLFKENKNLNEDLVKVKEERVEAVFMIDQLLEYLGNNEFEKFEERILVELEGHNKLEEFTMTEKHLRMEIKKLTTRINNENLAFQTEMDEKNFNIQGLKKELNKTKTESLITLKYQQKELETSEATQMRLYQQMQEELLKDKKKIEEVKEREDIVFKKNKEYLLKENDKLLEKIEIWENKKNDLMNHYQEKFKVLENKKKQDEIRRENLKGLYDEEVKNKKDEDERLKEFFEKRRIKQEEEKNKENVITIIQYYFEDWYFKVGQFIKKKKKPLKQ